MARYTKRRRPGQVKPRTYTTKSSSSSNPLSSVGNSLAQVGRWVRENPGQAALTVAQSVGMDPRPPWMREKQDIRDLGVEAGLTAAGAIPIAGPAARIGATAAKAGKVATKATKAATATKTATATKAGTSTVKRVTAKRTPKRTPAKRTPPKQTKAQVDKQRTMSADRMEAQNPALKTQVPARPQPKPSKMKTDAPGTGKSSGNLQPKPARKPKYKPTPTSKAGKPKPKTGEVRDTPMSREEVLSTLRKFDFDEAAPFGPRDPGTKSGYSGLERAHKRAKVRNAGERQGVTKKTPVQRERSEAQVGRRKKAGGNPQVQDAANNPKLGGDKAIGQKTPRELQRALRNPRSSESRLLKTLERRARRGNLREGELQTLNRLRDNAPSSVTTRETKGLMQSDIRDRGAGQPITGSRPGSMVNPPRNVKASNPKWREEGGKGAPRGPKGQSGTPKRGDNAAMRAKEEDGVTRNKGKGGQRRRQVAPSQELVPTGRGRTRTEATGRRGATSRGPAPSRPGRTGNLPAGRQTVKGEVVRVRPAGGRGRAQREPIDLTTRPINRGGSAGGRTAIAGGGRLAIEGPKKAAEAAKKKRKFGKYAGGVALGGAALGGALYGIGQVGKGKDQAKADDARAPRKPAETLRDKYGRKISREEYNKREAYRKSLAGMTEKQKKKARKAEMERREAYRKGEGSTRFGKNSETITRNLDIREGVSSRKVNKEMKAAAGKSGNRQAAMEARKKYQRKKK